MSPDYPARTLASVRAADARLRFGDQATRGGKLTLRRCSLTCTISMVVDEETMPRIVRK